MKNGIKPGKLLVVGLSLLLLFGADLLPLIPGLTGPGQRVLGLFMGSVLLWLLVDIGWPSALAVGRNVVAMLAGHAERGRCVVAYSPPRAAPPHRLLASEFTHPLVAPPLSGDGRPA